MSKIIIKGFWNKFKGVDPPLDIFVIPEQTVEIDGESVRIEADGEHPLCQLIAAHEKPPYRWADELGAEIQQD